MVIDCWEILGIQPISDKKLIKRAYAKQLKKYQPEDDPQGFQRLREAYETAINKAENSNFNLDEVEAKKIFDSLEKLINKPGFSKKAVEWSLKTYEDVVIALGGVRTAKEIEINT